MNDEAGITFFGKNTAPFQLKGVKLPVTDETLRQLEILREPNNIYFTPSIFDFTFKKNNGTVKFLTSLWADIDHCSEAEALEALHKTDLPEPTFIVFSGHGVHFYWNLSFNLYKKNYSKSWQEVMHYIRKKLQEALPEDSEAGADAKVIDFSRFMRVPGSYNCKTGRILTSFISYKPELKYNFLDDFYYTFVEPRTENKVIYTDFNRGLEWSRKVPVSKVNALKQASLVRSGISSNFIEGEDTGTNKKQGNYVNTYNKEFVQDIVRLIRVRNFDMAGCRNNCLLYLKLMKQSDGFIKAVNDSFNEPVTDTELENILKADYEKFPKRSTVFQGLNVTSEEEKHMKRLVNEDSAAIEKELKTRLKQHEKELNQAFRDTKALYLPAYAKRSGKKQSDKISASILGITDRTFKRWRQKREVEEVLTEKARIIDSLIVCIDEMTESVLLMASDDQVRDRLTDLESKALKMRDKAIRLRQLVLDNEELQGSLFRVNGLEKKCTALIALSKAA